MRAFKNNPVSKARTRRQKLRLRRARTAAAAYAWSDRSDPFAYRRALSHMLAGVAGPNHYGRNARP